MSGTKKIGKYLIVAGTDVDNKDARFGIFIDKGRVKLYRSGPMSNTQTKRIYNSIGTVRDVESYLSRH